MERGVSHSNTGGGILSIEEAIRQDYPHTGEEILVEAVACDTDRPAEVDIALTVINTLMGGHGIEAITNSNAFVDSYYRDTVGLYINIGDTYKKTIIFDTKRRRFVYLSVGDFVEQKDKEYKTRNED